jgi:drug/metabolite transporter (DMT)-like permease
MHVTAEGRWKLPLALGTVYLAWGGTYPAIRVMVETVPPLLGTAARFALAGLLLGAFLLARRGRRRFAMSRRQLLGVSAVGVVILGDIGLLALAEQEVPAGLAALIIASVPLWIVLLRIADGQRPRPTTMAAVAVGIAGVALLVTPAGETSGPPIGWLLLLVAAAAIEAAGQFYSQRVDLPADLLVSITTVSTYAYVNPVVAVLVGWALLSEPVTLTIAAGAAAVLLSVALIVRRGPGAA